MARFRDNAMLQTRDGRLFLAAQSLDSVAIGVAQVALPWLVLDATGSEAQAGLVFMLGLAPYVVFGLPAGLIADRFRRQTVIWMAHAFQACVAVIVPVWAIFGTPPIAVVAVTAFAVGSARAFSDAGAFGAISSLIGREQFSSGQAILAASWSIGLVAGPAIGGALIGVVGAAATLGGAGRGLRGRGGADPDGALELRRPGAVGGRRARRHLGGRAVPAQGPDAAHAERRRHAVEPGRRRIVGAGRAAAAPGGRAVGARGRRGPRGGCAGRHPRGAGAAPHREALARAASCT